VDLVEGGRKVSEVAADLEVSEQTIFFTNQAMTAEDGLLFDNWKYIARWDRDSKLLFDLESDPAEQRNLIDEQPERAQESQRRLVALLKQQISYYRDQLWVQGYYPQALP
jgi:hypothetical protein